MNKIETMLMTKSDASGAPFGWDTQVHFFCRILGIRAEGPVSPRLCGLQVGYDPVFSIPPSGFSLAFASELFGEVPRRVLPGYRIQLWLNGDVENVVLIVERLERLAE